MTSRTILLVATLAVALPSGCDRPRGGDEVKPLERAEERVEEAREQLDRAGRKVVAASDDFAEARNAFSRVAHDRIEKIDRRLIVLGEATDDAAKKASIELRQQRDVIAGKLRLVDASAQEEFRAIRSEVASLLDELEQRAGVK